MTLPNTKLYGCVVFVKKYPHLFYRIVNSIDYMVSYKYNIIIFNMFVVIYANFFYDVYKNL